MLKIIALLFLIWVFFRALGMIFRTLMGSADQNRNSRYDNYSNPRKKGNVNVDHDPNHTKKGFDGGEYVDYEEVD
jgi:hypothetical protein